MTIRIFNALLLAGWALIVLGVWLGVGLSAALVVGGALILAITLKLAFRAGVTHDRTTKD